MSLPSSSDTSTPKGKKIAVDFINCKKVDDTKKKLVLVNKTTVKASELTEEKKERIIKKSRIRARKLARSILRRWNARLELEEVDSIVDLSLCEAANKYNPSIGASFMTFLFYHLRGNLIRAITNSVNSQVIHIFDHEGLGDHFENIDPEKGIFVSDIADALNGNEEILPDEAILKQQMLELSQSAREKLDALAKEVLERLYIKEEQLIDIAYSLGYSRCHLSRVKKRALGELYEQLKTPFEHEGEKPNFGDDDLSKTRKRKVHRRQPRSESIKTREKHYMEKFG